MAENIKPEVKVANEELQNRKSDETVAAYETESVHTAGETNDTQRCSSNEVAEFDENTSSPKPDVNEFSTKTSPGDFVLRVEDKAIHVNKAVLCLFSPVFNEMLNEDCEEKYSTGVKLTGMKYEDVLEFLRCMYPNIVKPITMNNVYTVLPLAHEYQVTMLKKVCQPCLVKYLSGKNVPEDIYEVLEKACLYELGDVKKKCIGIVSKRPHEDYDEAERKFTFSDDVGNKIRKKILENLTVKYKDVVAVVCLLQET